MSAFEDEIIGESGYSPREKLCILDKQLFSTIILIYIAILGIITLMGTRLIIYLTIYISNRNSINNSILNDLIKNKADPNNSALHNSYQENTAKKTIDEIQKQIDYISQFSIVTVIIIAFYYFFQSVDDYEVEKTQSNLNSMIANFFSVVANIIRFINTFTITEKSTENAQDDIQKDINEDTDDDTLLDLDS